MSVTAKLRYLRIAPRKVRLVADLIRGKKVEQAQTILNFTVKKAARPLLKLLNSAVANAKHNFQLDELNLYISKITVDEGPKLKRWRPRARGQVAPIQKKTSHITLVLDEIKKGQKKKLSKKKKGTEGSKNELSSAETTKDKEERAKKTIKTDASFAKGRSRELRKPRIGTGLKKIFRRKAF